MLLTGHARGVLTVLLSPLPFQQALDPALHHTVIGVIPEGPFDVLERVIPADQLVDIQRQPSNIGPLQPFGYLLLDSLDLGPEYLLRLTRLPEVAYRADLLERHIRFEEQAFMTV